MRRHFPMTPRLAAAALCALAAASAQAADLNARDFFSAPAGTSLGVSYLPLTRSSEYRGASGTDKDASLSVNVFAYRQVWFSDICGRLCTPQFIIPYADISARGPGQTSRVGRQGFGDPQIGGTLFFINEPQSRTYSGLLTLLSLPLGEYSASRPGVSPGGNRWALHLNYNYTKGVGRNWVLEGNLEAQIYGHNSDYAGGELAQKPLYRLQAFASYDFTPATYGALRLVHARGAAMKLDGVRLADTRQRTTQLGFEVGHALDARNHLMVSLSRDVAARNAFKGNYGLLRYVHVF